MIYQCQYYHKFLIIILGDWDRFDIHKSSKYLLFIRQVYYLNRITQYHIHVNVIHMFNEK